MIAPSTPHPVQPEKHYDLIIIGGGIHGATMAWEAISRGLSVLLLEKNDFGSATSANSLKIIHGGIRYLQDLDFSRMRQSINERRAFLRIAPHLVSPLACVMPTYRDLSKSKLALWTGMKIYDAIACDRNRAVDPQRHIKAGEIITLDELERVMPGLRNADMTGGARWYDAQVYNSERLVLAFIMSARQRGADVCNYVEVKTPVIEHDRVRGVLATDRRTGKDIEVSADAVINCAGPWVSQDLQYKQYCYPSQRGEFAKAVNIIVRRRIADCAVGIKFNVQTEAGQSNRLMFITPWRDGTLIGTWYFSGSFGPDDLNLSDEELASCIAQVNSACPALDLALEDIANLHIGLLPMESIDQHGEPALQKKNTICHARDNGGVSGLFWIQGVKYTTARCVAEETVDRAAEYLGKAVTPSRTSETPLYGGDIVDISAYTRQAQGLYKDILSEREVERLIKNYGTNLDKIATYADDLQELGEQVPGTVGVLKAEISFVLDNEMVSTLSDLLLRRTDIGSFELPKKETIDYCADLMATRLGWSETEKTRNINDLIDHYHG